MIFLVVVGTSAYTWNFVMNDTKTFKLLFRMSFKKFHETFPVLKFSWLKF